MKKRKLQRSRLVKKKKIDKDEKIISFKAQKTAESAVAGVATIDCIGNFIFFSTPAGDGWMLDHRQNFALSLAKGHKILPYKIIENRERFQVEWKERYRIENTLFLAGGREEDETVYHNYPVDAIEGLITLIKKRKKISAQKSTS